MVVYILYIRATLENVSSLTLKSNADLCISVRNPIDHSQVRERIVIDSSAYEAPVTTHSNSNHHHHGSKKHQHPDHEEGLCHFALKWNHDDPARSTIRVLFPPSSSSSLESSESDTDAETASNKSSTKSSNKSSKKKSSDAPAVTAAIAKLKHSVQESDSDSYVPILAFDCQGEIEPFTFHPMGNEFMVVNTSGQTFGNNNNDENEVDLSNGQDWNHIDLSTGLTSINNFQAKFE